MDLSTTYLGMKLKNPVVCSASPLSRSVDNVKKMEDHGAAAVVMYSLFEEQIRHDKEELDHFLATTSGGFSEALSYFPEPESYYNLDAEGYLNQLRKLKESVSIPVIASLNGVSQGGWEKYAREMEKAGADAIELNIYYIAADSQIPPNEIEDMYVNDLTLVKNSVNIPVSIKIGPYFSSFSHLANRLDEAGADGLVLFNRFYQPDIDLENLEIVPNLIFSSPFDMRLPLRWIAILYSRIKANLAATGGIHRPEDAIKMIMVGADVTMIASVMFLHGINVISDIVNGMEKWMDAHEYSSIEQMKGSMSYKNVAHPAAYARANYMKTLHSIQ